jgi:hypothetical protein
VFFVQQPDPVVEQIAELELIHLRGVGEEGVRRRMKREAREKRSNLALVAELQPSFLDVQSPRVVAPATPRVRAHRSTRRKN